MSTTKRFGRPRLEALEERVMLFSNAALFDPIHEEITEQALGFLKDEIINDIKDEHVFVDATSPFEESRHFDGSFFQESAAVINAEYQDALVQANPDDFDSGDLADQFGQLLHTVQDFYAHTNWVNMGRTDLVDDGLGLWSAMAPYTEVKSGVVVVQGAAPAGVTLTLDSTAFTVSVSLPGGGTAQGLISGRADFGTDGDYAGPFDGDVVNHDNLNKDDAGRSLFAPAVGLATEQTAHEFKRLGALIKNQYGHEGVCKLLEEWVKPDVESQERARELLDVATPIDLVFVIDATGSMADDIDAVKAAATDIVNDISEVSPCFRVGIVLYKDFGDDFVTRTHLPFSHDKEAIIASIQTITVGGGGDFPEAVYSGLVHAIDNLDGLGLWRGEAFPKLTILMGDAPPHDPEPNTGYTQAIVSKKAFDADPVDIHTLTIGSNSQALESFQSIAEANRGGSFNALTADDVVEELTKVIKTFDTTRPTVTVNQATAQADPIGTSPINFTVQFSEEVTGFTDADVTLSGTAGATTAVVTGSGATYNVAVSGMTSDGTVIASIAEGVAADAEGNTNAASTSTDNTVTFNSPPTVTINQAGAQADPTGTSPINFTVQFSEEVTGFTDADVTLSGTAGATTAVVTGSGTTYTVAVSGMTQDGTVIASIAAGVANDAAGNPNTASTSTDNTVTFDTLPPLTTGPIVGTEQDDVILITQGAGTFLEVSLNGVVINRVDPTSLTSLLIEGRGGNDNIEVAENVQLPVSVLGGAGDDTLIGGGGGDTLEGGDGNDLLFGRGGADQMFGEAGNDSMDGQEGNDSLGGGAGDDFMFGSAGTDLMFGEAGNDAMDGGADNDAMDGGADNDLLFGSGGNDLLFGSDGNDAMDGGEGNDGMDGGAANDVMFGSAGADVIFGLSGNDSIDGGAGDDAIDAGAGNDLVFGSAGNDLIFGGLGNDAIDGNDGNDSIDASDGNDLVFGSGGVDLIFGGLGNDSIAGGSGLDFIDGGPGFNLIFD